MTGAMLLALAATGCVFAYVFTGAIKTLNITVIDSDFVSVSPNTSRTPCWTIHGMQKGQTGSGTLFNLDSSTSSYRGDFTATITLANADALIIIYRYLILAIEV